MSTTTGLRPEDIAWDNNDRPLKRGHEEVVTPTTPRPPSSQTFQSLSAEVSTEPVVDAQGHGSLPGDEASRPPTTFAFPAQPEPQRGMLYRGSSQTSMHSSMAVDDVDMDGSEDDQDGSDNDTENGDPGRSSKKKKGQRFFCTEYPPCNLSFTRSEHLARHIRYTQRSSFLNLLAFADFYAESILGNGHSSAIATGDSPVLITFDSMHKQCMSTKRFPATHLPQQELDFKDKSALTEYVQLEAGHVAELSAALEVYRGVTAGICPLPALVQMHLRTAILSHIAGLHR